MIKQTTNFKKAEARSGSWGPRVGSLQKSCLDAVKLSLGLQMSCLGPSLYFKVLPWLLIYSPFKAI